MNTNININSESSHLCLAMALVESISAVGLLENAAAAILGLKYTLYQCLVNTVLIIRWADPGLGI